MSNSELKLDLDSIILTQEEGEKLGFIYYEINEDGSLKEKPNRNKSQFESYKETYSGDF